jgi:aminobenzoyl-glutamate utilization protein B
MARAGLYDDVDFFLDWHPLSVNFADYDKCNAYFNLKYHYKGRTAHGNMPWNGRSALDAAVLTGQAIEMLREHIEPGETAAANTINYNFPDIGPIFPNVVPDKSTLWVIGRFQSVDMMEAVMKRIDKCAEAGALATETTVTKQIITITHDKIPNKVLAEIVHKNFQEVGVPVFTEEEHNFAMAMQVQEGMESRKMDESLQSCKASSTAVCDTSEFSWNAPYATFWMTCAPSAGWHNWVITACSGASMGKKTLTNASKVLSGSAIDIITSSGVIEAAKAELNERLNGRTYKCLIPDDIEPPLGLNKEAMDKFRKK